MAKPSEVFHEGERAMQRATGEQEAADQNAPMIADSVTGGASRYLREQRMLIAASRDAKEQPWASILFGQAGFVSADRDGTAITVDWSITFSGDGDVLWANLSVDGPVGLLAAAAAVRLG